MKKSKVIHNTLFLLIFVTLFSFTACSDGIDGQLKTIAENANKFCPKKLDDYTRLDSCSALPDKHYRYYHTITGLEVTDTTLVKNELKQQIIRVIKSTPEMSFFRENDVVLEYRYNSDQGKYLFTIVATPEEYK